MPPDLSAKFALVTQHINHGRQEQARQILHRILQQYPNHPDANHGMAVVLVGLGQFEQARYFADRARQADPDNPYILTTFGSILTQLGRLGESIPLLERAASLDPTFVNARINLGNALWTADRCVEAVERLEQARALAPDDPETGASLTVKYALMARTDRALEIGRDYAARFPAHTSVARALAVAMLNDPACTPEQVFEAHRAFGRALDAAVPPANPSHPNTPDPDRPLRIGFISPDFRGHSVPYFLEPLLESLDRAAFSPIAYSAHPAEDDTTRRLKPRFDAWRAVHALTDPALAEKVRADRIDILIDLAGFTVGHRLGAFQLRPAPVQATYCGYPSSLGLSTIAHRLVDSLTDPPGADRLATESLVRLDPCFLCYQPPADAPALAPPPSLAAGHVTFGSFNATSKLNDATFRLWHAILDRVPGSRLLLKAVHLADASLRDQIHRRLEGLGIARDHVTLLGPAKSTPDHLATYHRVDVGLDTFPYHGTTTTCEALWMGVPIVTREGQAHAGRVGVSLLSAVGIPSLIARTDDEYVAKAVDLAADLDRRRRWREGPESLRAMMLASPLMDRAALAARFGSALRGMWRGWCAARPRA